MEDTSVLYELITVDSISVAISVRFTQRFSMPVLKVQHNYFCIIMKFKSELLPIASRMPVDCSSAL